MCGIFFICQAEKQYKMVEHFSEEERHLATFPTADSDDKLSLRIEMG